MNKKYVVELTEQEPARIQEILYMEGTSRGIRNRCRIIIMMDESQGPIPKQMEIDQRVGGNDVTIHHTVKSYCTLGQEAAIANDRSLGRLPLLQENLRPESSHWLVQSHPRAMPAGRFVC